MLTRLIRIGMVGVVGASLAGRPATAFAGENAPTAQRVGDTIINKIGMKFAYIPAGEFMMGSPAGEKERIPDETQHRVKISKSFMLGVHEVTLAQWKTVMGDNPTQFEDPDLPVERVTWDDAVKFCQKLSEKEGKRYRLPTEAEWEYACRAGTKTMYYAGDEEKDLAEAGWYLGNAEMRTHPVGQKKPNAWGLYDMHGNVLEWCGDWYGEYAKADAVDPIGPNDGTLRVLRGGSWFPITRLCRAAHRSKHTPDYRYNFIGFRVTMDFP
jgi:formylglycine-generating enzyme required for sulfatase activity